MTPRLATLADIPWIHGVCEAAYPDGTYHAGEAEAWMRGLIESERSFVLRGEYAFIAVTLVRLPYNRKLIDACFLPMASLGGSGRELLVMVGRAIGWAREHGAQRFIFGSTQSPNGTDLRALAAHFGAEPVCPNYKLEL